MAGVLKKGAATADWDVQALEQDAANTTHQANILTAVLPAPHMLDCPPAFSCVSVNHCYSVSLLPNLTWLIGMQKFEEESKRARQLAKAGLQSQAEESEAAAKMLQAQAVAQRTQAAAASEAALEKRQLGDKAAADSAAASAEVQQLRKAAANCSVILLLSFAMISVLSFLLLLLIKSDL